MYKLIAMFMTLSFVTLLLSSCSPERISTKALLDLEGASEEIVEHETEQVESEEDAASIAEYVEALEGIKSAAVVVTGTTVIVGVSLLEELDTSRLVSLKKRIVKEIKELNPRITNVAVSSAPDLYQRIHKMSGAENSEPELWDNANKEIFFRVAPVI